MTNTQTITSNRRLGRRFALVLALGAAALMAVPATGFAATKFGAKLNKTSSRRTRSRRSRATGCRRSPARGSRWMPTADAGRGERAPKDGVIKKIKLIAGGPGHFRLQLAEAKPGQEKAKVVDKGPRIDYNGQARITRALRDRVVPRARPGREGPVPGHQAPRRRACCGAAPVARTSSCSSRALPVGRPVRDRSTTPTAAGSCSRPSTSSRLTTIERCRDGVPVRGPVARLVSVARGVSAISVAISSAFVAARVARLLTAARVRQPEPPSLKE